MDIKKIATNPWVLGGAGLVALFVVYRSLSSAAAASAASSNNASAGAGFPLFQSAALPSSLEGSAGGGNVVTQGGSGTDLTSAITAALASANASNASASSNLGQDNATLLFDQLAPGLEINGTNGIDGSFSVLNGTTTFHLSTTQVAAPIVTGGGGSNTPPTGGGNSNSNTTGNNAPSSITEFVGNPASGAFLSGDAGIVAQIANAYGGIPPLVQGATVQDLITSWKNGGNNINGFIDHRTGEGGGGAQ